MQQRSVYNKTAVDSQRTNQWLLVGRVKGGGKDSSLFLLMNTPMYQINKQGYIVQHRKIQPLFCNNFKWSITYKNIKLLGFPGGAVVGSPPASAGDTGSSPGPGGSHMPQSNWARAPQLLSLRSGACEPQLLSPSATTAEAHAPGARAPQWGGPPQ